jgi:hypothetical protein
MIRHGLASSNCAVVVVAPSMPLAPLLPVITLKPDRHSISCSWTDEMAVEQALSANSGVPVVDHRAPPATGPKTLSP